jgi:hypothetical protein
VNYYTILVLDSILIWRGKWQVRMGGVAKLQQAPTNGREKPIPSGGALFLRRKALSPLTNFLPGKGLGAAKALLRRFLETRKRREIQGAGLNLINVRGS